MSKTVTLRLDESTYELIRSFSALDNRPLSNFIETAALRYISQIEEMDEFEMQEIVSNVELKASLLRGSEEVKAGRGKQIG